MRRPVTDDQWQDAVDAASLALTFELGRQYGFVNGGLFDVNVEECFQILYEGRERGIEPNAALRTLRGAAEALLKVCDEEMSVLHRDDYLGQELRDLRSALALGRSESPARF